MRLLLDTSGSEVICALADNAGVVVEERVPTSSEASRQFGVVVANVLGVVHPRDLTAVVVGVGPGSFIGTRVGISYANGLAAAAGIPLFCANSLAAIAATYSAARLAVLRDARRGELYMYSPSNPAECQVVPLACLAEELDSRGINQLVLDDSQTPGIGLANTRNKVLEVASELGAELTLCPGVPAEGLRRLLQHAERVGYAEPVYLRGFI